MENNQITSSTQPFSINIALTPGTILGKAQPPIRL
jgi:hypothetical protein